MTSHYAAGEQDAARAAYERCRRALSEELGVDPLPETMSLHERILRRAPIAVLFRREAARMHAADLSRIKARLEQGVAPVVPS